MKYSVTSPVNDQFTMIRGSVDRESSAHGCLVKGGKPNRCVFFPAKTTMVAETLERRHQNWIVRTKVACDLIVQVGDFSFHLHKIPMVSKSAYINRHVFEARTLKKDTKFIIKIDNFPGGIEIFELIIKFCYEWKVDVSASNVAPLYCAAHFLEMTDDLEFGNLISKSEAFLSFLIFSSWKDTFRILKSCERISVQAKELQIVKRCTEAISFKACMSPKAFGFVEEQEIDEKWWFEDVSVLRIDHFIELIESAKRKGMKPELVGESITHWSTKGRYRITSKVDNIISKRINQQLKRVTTERFIRLLPVEENSITCNFLLHLLKWGLTFQIDSELLNKLEMRIASVLENCSVSDLLVKNYKENDTKYNVAIITRVVNCYVSWMARKSPQPRNNVVGKLVDEYLTLVSRDKNLKEQDFRFLAEALPVSARTCDDNLYRAIDMYLKVHSGSTDEERKSESRAMDYHKLSEEARQHTMKNSRLPLDIVIQFILLEQVNLARSMTDSKSEFHRTKTQTIIRVNRDLEEEQWTGFRNEVDMMKKEVETMKTQLSNLQMCINEIQRQAKICIVLETRTCL